MARPVRRSVGSNLSSPTPSTIEQTNNYHQQQAAHSTINSNKSDSKKVYTNSHGIFQNNSSSTPATSKPPSISATPLPSNNASNTNLNQTLTERERIRMEFYATYDVMTGVRIAATLGGFFGLMVFLVIYKSRSHSSHPLKAMKKNPQLAAQAAIVMQAEEQRELEAAWHATSRFFLPEEESLPSLGYKRERMMSLGNISAPPALHRGFRFSSYGGGYSSLLEPTRRFSYSGNRRKSASESSRILSACQVGESFEIDEYLCTSDVEEVDDEFDLGTTTAEIGHHGFLNVPGQGMNSRRCSDITCSTDSYLERRCSAITIGLISLPPISSRNPSRRPSHETASDQFPNIQVIQPTPKTSPCPSEGNVNDKTRSTRSKSYEPSDSFDYISEYPDEYHEEIYNRRKSKISDSTFTSDRPPPLRRAPLASLSSFKISSADYQDSDLRSLGSDSVFAESIYADTDDDMEQFSTDSDELSNNDPQSPRMCSSNRSINYSSGSKTTQIEHPAKIIEEEFEDDVGVECASVSVDVGGAKRKEFDTSVKSLNLVNTFKTKAIIERHENRSLNTSACALSVNNELKVVGADDSVNMSRINVGACCEDDRQLSSSCTISCSPIKTLSSEVAIEAQVVVTKGDSKSSTTTTTSKTNKNTSSYKSNCNNSNKSNSQNNKLTNDISKNNIKLTSECDNIDVRYVDSNRQQQQQHQQATSPSVILELPVLSVSNNQLDVGVASLSLQSPMSSSLYHQPNTLAQSNQIYHPDDDTAIDIDPSMPGPSRKWSKETLF